METPSQILAQRIVDRLQKEGLLALEAANKIQASVADGRMRPEDWRFLLEKTEKKKVAQ
jgi:hypothetical protein